MSSRVHPVSRVTFGCLFVMIAVSPAFAQDLIFYEGNGCTQDIVFVYNSGSMTNDDCTKSGECHGDNDEARSVKVQEGATPGTIITVFDSPSGDTTDDYARITVGKKNSGDVCVGSFEKSTDWRATVQGGTPRVVRVAYVRKNGLDGKVSRVLITPPANPDF